MRVLVVGSDHRWRMERSVERALRRAGHVTRLVDDRRLARVLGRRLAQRTALVLARRFAPDVVILGKGMGLDLVTVERLVRGRRSALWYQDPPYFRHIDRPDVRHVAEVGRRCDAFFVTGFDAEWRALGYDARFLPAAADAALHPVPPAVGWGGDVAFIGTGYDAGRAEFLAALSRRAHVRVWGPGWERWRGTLEWSGRAVEGEDVARVCSSSSLVLGVNPEVARGATNYASDRVWITLLSGGCYLGERTAGMDRLLLDGVHCSWYAGLDDCATKVAHWLAHPGERAALRERGEAFARAHHTFDARVPFLLEGRTWVNPLDAVPPVPSGGPAA